MNSKVAIVKVPELDIRTNKMVEKTELILPKLNDKELKERYHQIKPIVEYNSDYYKLRKFHTEELKHLSFLWFKPEDLRNMIDLEDYQVLDEFDCYHTYAYQGLFKPTISEVLSQYPDELLKESNAFMLYDYPRFITDIPGYHESTVKALKLKK